MELFQCFSNTVGLVSNREKRHTSGSQTNKIKGLKIMFNTIIKSIRVGYGTA